MGNNIQQHPDCLREDCFGCDRGRCHVLVDNDFGERECPFFKTTDQYQADRRASRERLKAIGWKGAYNG